MTVKEVLRILNSKEFKVKIQEKRNEYSDFMNKFFSCKRKNVKYKHTIDSIALEKIVVEVLSIFFKKEVDIDYKENSHRDHDIEINNGEVTLSIKKGTLKNNALIISGSRTGNKSVIIEKRKEKLKKKCSDILCAFPEDDKIFYFNKDFMNDIHEHLLEDKRSKFAGDIGQGQIWYELEV